MKALWFLTVVSAAFYAAGASASAMVEPCPAHASVLQPSGKSADASVYTYTLGALSKRSVAATLIADTDRGWFAWTVSSVPLESVTRTDTAGTFPLRYEAWVSRELSVAFPGDVTVKHAWVASGRATGESTFNWDAKGEHACDVPGFEAPPSPAPAVPAAPPVPASVVPETTLAKATSPPFEIASCDKPFVAAAVVSGPALNASLLGGQNEYLGPEATIIDVALDGAGGIIDAWIEGSTHSAFDKLAMGGALHSVYRGAVSYCRPAEATVKYTAWYQPMQ